MSGNTVKGPLPAKPGLQNSARPVRETNLAATPENMSGDSVGSLLPSPPGSTDPVAHVASSEDTRLAASPSTMPGGSVSPSPPPPGLQTGSSPGSQDGTRGGTHIQGSERVQPSAADTGRQGQDDGPATNLPNDSLNAAGARDPSKKPARPLPFTGLLSANRDWTITIECRADGVILLPQGQRIASGGPSTNNSVSLREAVQQMISRRQASLRPGEMAYRPMIRFRVWPDGARTYYQAFPILEGLGLPMSRENVEPEGK
jgi:hypothetical protein